MTDPKAIGATDQSSATEDQQSEADNPVLAAPDQNGNGSPPEQKPPAMAAGENRRSGIRTLARSGEPCTNCGTTLVGAYCHACGQPTRNLIRFFPVLLSDLLDDLFDLDSRLFRTLGPLFLRPGRITIDYFAGRRARYVPPLRLFIFLNIVFFVVMNFLAGGAEYGINGGQGTDAVVNAPVEAPADPGESDPGDTNEPTPGAEQAVQTTDDSPPSAAGSAEEASTGFGFTANDDEPIEFIVQGKPWDPETDPVAIGWLPDWANEDLTEAVERSIKNAERVRSDPRLLVEQVLTVLPQVMFLFLPIFALLLEIFYIFKRRYYVEHLVVALNSHSFIYLTLLLVVMLDTGAEAAGLYDHPVSDTVVGVLKFSLFAWIFLYLFISQKRIYDQGWFMTTIKFFLVGVSYMILLGFGVVFAIGLGLYLM